MSATATYAPVVRRQYANDGPEWTEEQKEEYLQQWENYRVLMQKRKEGMTRDFDATVLEVGPAHQVKNTFRDAKSEFRTVRTIRVQLAQEGVDMLRFQGDSADNPFNDKTLLNALIIATMGESPSEAEGFSIDFNDLVGKRIRVTLEKQRQREDGKRGGFWTKLKAIHPVFEDEDELPLPKGRASGAPTQSGSATSPASVPAATDEKAPWE